MKVTVIYGTGRRGNTWTLVQRVKERLSALGAYEFKEYTLPGDLPEFCSGCMVCLEHGREKCPHAKYVAPIEKDLLECDGIILASPNYVFDVSGPMKVFLDHLFTLWVSHRPEEAMFHKAGLVVSTAAGAGLGPVNRTMARSLHYWGVPRVIKLGLARPTLKDGPARMEKGAGSAAAKFHAALERRERVKPGPYIRIMFGAMRKMTATYEPDGLMARDKAHWQEKGYTAGKRPWERKK